MLLSSFFIVDIDQFDAVPDSKLPENAFLSYRITAANRTHIDDFTQKLFVSQKKNLFCIIIDLHDDVLIKADDELEKITTALVSLSFHYKYVKLKQDQPLIIFDTSKDNIDTYTVKLSEKFKEQGYGNIETVVINSRTKDGDTSKGKNLYYHLQQDGTGLFTEYNSLLRRITSSNYSIYIFLANPQILPDLLDAMSRIEDQIKQENPQVYHLLEENLALTKKEQEIQNKTGILEEQIGSLKNYLQSNESDSRYKRQITELLYFYKHEYEILPLWYKRFGHIIKVLKGQRTFKSLFKDDVKKYKN